MIRQPVESDIETVKLLYPMIHEGEPVEHAREHSSDVVVGRIRDGLTEVVEFEGLYRSRLTVAEIDGQCAGYSITASPLTWFQGRVHKTGQLGQQVLEVLGNMLEIQGIAVHPQFRRSGVGNALLADAEAHAGTPAVYVLFYKANVVARDWYRRHGYHIGRAGEPWRLYPLDASGAEPMLFDAGGVAPWQRLAVKPLMDGLQVRSGPRQSVTGLFKAAVPTA